MINPQDSPFDIHDLKISNLRDFTISGSVDQPYGRKFTLQFMDEGTLKSTKEIAFKDLFKAVSELAEKEFTKQEQPDLANLEVVQKALRKFQIEEAQTTDKCERKKALNMTYKILTFISRIFTFGSHQDKIADLQNKVNQELKKTTHADNELMVEIDSDLKNESFTMAYNKTDNLNSTELKEYYRTTIIDQLVAQLRAGQFMNGAMTLLRTMTPGKLKDTLIVEVSQNKIQNGDYSGAKKLAEQIDNTAVKENLLAKIKESTSNTGYKTTPRKAPSNLPNLQSINDQVNQGSALTNAIELEDSKKSTIEQLKGLLSTDSDEHPLPLLSNLSTSAQKDNLLIQFVDKYIKEKNYLKAGSIIDQCTDETLRETLIDKVCTAMEADRLS